MRHASSYLLSMKHITILVPERAVPAAIVDSRYMFTAVNGFLEEEGKGPLFNVQLIGSSPEVTLQDGLITIHPDGLLKDITQTDLIIVPAISGDLKEGIELNREFFPWIVEQHSKGAEVASLCVGSFLLASTGLLDDRVCSTHWISANEFRAMFPAVQLVDSKVITEQGGLYSSGGASSYWNLLLYLVEKYVDRKMAITASKYFLLDMARNSQSPFAMFMGQKDHEDAEVLWAQNYIETHHQERILVEELASNIGMSRRTFERRFKRATSNTVTEYIQRVRVEAAKKQLESGFKTVSEVMYGVGYNDPRAFREVFRKVAGISPLEYKDRYKQMFYA